MIFTRLFGRRRVEAPASPATPRQRLMRLMRRALDAGAQPTRVREVDAAVDQRRPAMIVKHDVHDLDLDGLVRFASEEAGFGLFGSYFFMPPDHPLTARTYDFAAQAAAMQRVQALGHEVGVHVDPLFLVHWKQRPLREVMTEIVARFRDAGIELVSGNMHGNSQFKGLDRNGYGTSFDLFEEIARQPDYPTLQDVAPDIAAQIREHRTRLSDLGFAYWADMPLFSRRLGYVGTHFITDNQFEKRGTFEVRVDPQAVGRYKLADRQPPGSRSDAAAREVVPLQGSAASLALPAGSRHVALHDEALGEAMAALAVQPTLILIHPQHYL